MSKSRELGRIAALGTVASIGFVVASGVVTDPANAQALGRSANHVASVTLVCLGAGALMGGDHEKE